MAAQQPPFRIFTTQDGLVRNWVTKIRRDSKGFLWFCTVEGISLFDGYRFTNFSTRDGLPSRLVMDMLEGSGGDYWFATQGGLARFHMTPGNGPAFDSIRVGDSQDSNSVRAIHEDGQGTIWCATGAGLYRFRPGERGRSPEFVPLDAARPPAVTAMAEDSHHNLWAATGRGLFRRRADGVVDRIPIELRWDFANSMVFDGQDCLWAGGGFGLEAIATSGGPPRLLPPERLPRIPREWINQLHRDGEAIWVGQKSGLARFYPDRSPMDVLRYTASASFPIRDVLAIGQDTEDNLWLGVGTLGVVRIQVGPSQLFTPADGLASAEVTGLVESIQGGLYAITGQWTLNERRGDRFEPIPLRVPRPGITWAQGQTVLQDREGAWWAASGDGVLRYAVAQDVRALMGKFPERIYSVREGLPSPIILRLFEDSRGDIWAGTSDGVGHWDRASGRWRGYPGEELARRVVSVHAFAEDRSGAVWVGMNPGGLGRFRGAAFEPFTTEVPRGGVNALLCDSRGTLWIGSSQGGVGRMDHPAEAVPRIERFGLERGLSSEHVFSLAEDSVGRIYVAGGRGVDRLDPETATLHHFTTSSGLPPGDPQFLFRDRQGDIWFASFYGLSRYRPAPDRSPEAPVPLIRGLHRGGEPYPVSAIGERMVAGMELPPGQNSVEIEFRALHFDTGEGLRYQYRLEGAETEWSKPSESQTVRYASLSAGRYSFAVRSITESGRISAGQATVMFQVMPVFWRRSWFVALVLLALAGGSVFLHRYRVNHLLAMERVRTRLATDLHDDLGSGLAEIAILSEVAMRQEHPRTVELLNSIAGRARSLRGAMADIVWTVDPREGRLTDLVLRLRQTAFTMLENEDRRVEFVAPRDEDLELELAPDVRRHVLLFFKEVVTNVARHANASAVRVEIEAERGRLRIMVRDNGCGFDARQVRAGRGLESLQYRAGELRGAVLVDSAPERGTEIALSLTL